MVSSAVCGVHVWRSVERSNDGEIGLDSCLNTGVKGRLAGAPEGQPWARVQIEPEREVSDV